MFNDIIILPLKSLLSYGQVNYWCSTGPLNKQLVIRNYNIGSFNNKMINFNGKMLKLQDLADKMLTLQSNVVAGKMLKLYDFDDNNCVGDLVTN